MVEKDGRIVASMPIFFEKRGPFRYFGHPPLTPWLGPWIRRSNAKYVTQLSKENSLMAELIDQIPDCDKFSQQLHRTVTNWLPFYWRGFEQTTLYTYVIDDLSNLDDLRDSEDIDGFIDLNEMVFLRLGRTLPYSRGVVTRLDKACRQRGVRKIWVAANEENRVHAAIYVVWDESSAYYLMGGAVPELRKTGASSLLLWEAIRHASSVTREFDFEGSMVKSIEHFFRSFGARQTPYFSVSYTQSRLLRLKSCLASLVR